MNLYAPDFVGWKKMSPSVMHAAAVRQQLKIPFDPARHAIRLVNAQAQSVLAERPGASISKLAQDRPASVMILSGCLTRQLGLNFRADVDLLS